MDVSKIVVKSSVAVVKRELHRDESLLETNAGRESVCVIIEFVACAQRNGVGPDILHAEMCLLSVVVRLEEIECDPETALLTRQQQRVVADQVRSDAYPERHRNGLRLG